MANKAALIASITEKVLTKRTQQKITPTPGSRQELSGMAFGEHNVLAKSLLSTTNGTGAWEELPGLKVDFLSKVATAIDNQ